MAHWAEIRRLDRAEQVPIKEISRRLGIARNTVRAVLAAWHGMDLCGALVHTKQVRTSCTQQPDPTRASPQRCGHPPVSGSLQSVCGTENVTLIGRP